MASTQNAKSKALRPTAFATKGGPTIPRRFPQGVSVSETVLLLHAKKTFLEPYLICNQLCAQCPCDHFRDILQFCRILSDF